MADVTVDFEVGTVIVAVPTSTPPNLTVDMTVPTIEVTVGD